MDCDVVVVGAGIVGSACARTLARAGLSVTVVDRGASAGGTTAHGEGNLLISDKRPGAELDLAHYSARLWRELSVELADELGPDFPSLEFEEKGGLVVATEERGAGPLLELAESQRQAGARVRVLSPAEALRLEPELNPAAVAAVHYPEDGQVQPVIAAEALLASARRAGARILPHTEVTGPLLTTSGELSGVLSTAGAIRAPRVVVAAGPWSARVASSFGATIPVVPRRGMVLVTTRMRHRIFRKVYDADYVGAVGSNDSDLQTSSVIESTASGTVLIGSSRQMIGFDDRLRVNVLEELALKATKLFPFLRTASVMRVYGGFRPFTPDHLPLIGPDTTVPGLWHANGHEGAGIGLAPATAEILGALITGERPVVAAAPYSPGRAELASVGGVR
ncbi:MAG: dependent oxidoreductase [Nocardioides sp.]|nr:dependent oxidoreductase [Nocardioides sp.]